MIKHLVAKLIRDFSGESKSSIKGLEMHIFTGASALESLINNVHLCRNMRNVCQLQEVSTNSVLVWHALSKKIIYLFLVSHLSATTFIHIKALFFPRTDIQIPEMTSYWLLWRIKIHLCL